jgi:glucokinase
VSAPRVIGVDLGGTKIAAGCVEPDGTVRERRETPTPVESQAELVEGIAAAIEPLARDGVDAIGFGVPGVIDRVNGRIFGATNVPLHDLDLDEVMHERFGAAAVVDNDANVAALAEWRLGAGRGTTDLVLLTLGTGVGGGVVIGGALYRGAAELGHVVVVADGPPCPGTCGGRGHLEALASGTAADRAAERLWGEGATAELLVGRAGEGDEEAIEALNGIGHLLGAAVGSFVNTFAPQRVVIGGGFGIAAFDWLEPSTVEIARRELVVPEALPFELVCAELGEDAGVVGAGLLAFETLADA